MRLQLLSNQMIWQKRERKKLKRKLMPIINMELRIIYLPSFLLMEAIKGLLHKHQPLRKTSLGIFQFFLITLEIRLTQLQVHLRSFTRQAPQALSSYQPKELLKMDIHLRKPKYSKIQAAGEQPRKARRRNTCRNIESLFSKMKINQIII